MLRCECSNTCHIPPKNRLHDWSQAHYFISKGWSKSSNILFASQETCQISNSNCDFQIFLFPDSKSQLIQSIAGQKQIEYPVAQAHYFYLTKQNLKIKWIAIEPFTPISSLRAAACRILRSSHHFLCCNWSCILIFNDVNCRLIKVRELCVHAGRIL